MISSDSDTKSSAKELPSTTKEPERRSFHATAETMPYTPNRHHHHTVVAATSTGNGYIHNGGGLLVSGVGVGGGGVVATSTSTFMTSKWPEI